MLPKGAPQGVHPSANTPETCSSYAIASAPQKTMPAKAYTAFTRSAEVTTPTNHPSSPQTQEAKNTKPRSPPSAYPTGAGGDCSGGHRSPPVFFDEARESQHFGYLTNKPLRF